jgi:transposase-like protein
MDSMAEWQSRPLDSVYPVVFIDALHVKIREGAVANRRQARWTLRWKTALNAFEITFDGRLSAARQ